MIHGLVYFVKPRQQPRLAVPSSLRPKLMDVSHGLFSHRGAKPLILMFKRLLHWPGVAKYVRQWIRGCQVCSRRKSPQPKRTGSMGSVYTSKPWVKLWIDFIGTFGKGLPLTREGYRHLLIVIDGFTRFPIAIPLRSKEPEDIANGLIEHVFTIFGLPAVIHSDNDSNLLEPVMTAVFKRFGVRRTTIVANNSNGNAQVERMMRYLNAAFTVSLPKYTDWAQYVHLILFAYRTLAHDTTGYSPFYLLFGREPVLPLEFSWMQPDVDGVYAPTQAESKLYVEKMAQRLVRAFKQVRRLQNLRHLRNKALRDKKAVHVMFEVHDPVLMWEPSSPERHYGPNRVFPKGWEHTKQPAEERPNKWTYRFSGPHIITEKLGGDNYKIFHTGRKKMIPVRATRLRRHYPFSADLSDTYPPQSGEVNAASSYPPPKETQPHEVKSAHPKMNDVCVVFLPENPSQFMWVARYLGMKDDNHQVQWFGNTRFTNVKSHGGFVHVTRGNWHPGWLNSQNAVVFRKSIVQSVPQSFKPYTNEWDDPRVLNEENFLTWGSDDAMLRKDGKLRSSVVQYVKNRMRSKTLKRSAPDQDTGKPVEDETFGAEDVDGYSLQPTTSSCK